MGSGPGESQVKAPFALLRMERDPLRYTAWMEWKLIDRQVGMDDHILVQVSVHSVSTSVY